MAVKKDDKKYHKVCKLIGVYSLTELRFATRISVLTLKGIGGKTLQYISIWLKSHRLDYGNHSIQDYLAQRSEIWEKETGFIVFKYKIRSAMPGLGLGVEWAVGSFQPESSNFAPDGTPRISFRGVPASVAKSLIDEYELEQAYKDNDGVIYDFPDGRFFKHFGNGSADLSRSQYISLAGGKDDE